MCALARRYISKEEARPWVAWEEEPDYNGDHEWEEWLAHIDTERIERERLEKEISALIAKHREESLLAHHPGVPLSAEEVAAAEEAVATESEALVGELRDMCLAQRRLGAEEAGCRPCLVANPCRACFPVLPEFAVPY